jgi:peptidoglycan LD-endopeptidase CwlK
VVGLLIGGYFLLACFLVWVILFPEGREFVGKLLRSLAIYWTCATQTSAQASDTARLKVTFVSKYFSNGGQEIALWIAKHKWAVCLALIMLAVPPIGIVMFSSGVQLQGFSDDRVQINSQVAALLKGEQLVPPAPLPPDIFVAAEAAMILSQQAQQPQYSVQLLVSASRNWQLLDPDYAQRLLLVFKIMREQHGYEMALLEGYRSPERQDTLSKMGGNVTGAKAFQSYHQFGLAADCAFLREGKLVISEKDPWAMKGYTLYGEVAESVGLTWGGRWKIMDFGHVEWRKPGFVRKAPAG